MPTAPGNVNDGSQAAPRLLIYGNDWGLSELPRQPHERPWSYEETLDRLVEAGFDGVQSGPHNADLIRAKGLRYCTSGRVNEPFEAEATVQAAAASAADCITLHVGWGMETDAEMDALIRAVLEAAERHRVPTYVETHRATVTQDLRTTHALLERFPELRFNGDFSHWYCGQELTYRGFEHTGQYLEPILQRVAFFHGRISNAQSMQVDVGNGWENPHAQNFKELWRRGMSCWLEGARPGDLLIFAPELGPPSSQYAFTTLDAQGRACEISDRWEQTLVLRRLAQEAWAEAQRQQLA